MAEVPGLIARGEIRSAVTAAALMLLHYDRRLAPDDRRLAPDDPPALARQGPRPG